MVIDTTASNGRDIPSPVAKRPLRTNIFDFARGAGSALLPLFPYGGDGDMVPCVAVFRGGAKHEGSVFEHTNSVDEVAITFGAQGSFLRPGQVFVGDKKHTVGSFLPKDPQDYVLMTITQRQAEPGVEQKETFTVICEKCSSPVIELSYDAKPDLGVPKGYAEPLTTLLKSAAGAHRLNESEEARKCPQCGHVNRPFAVGTWHWDLYEEQSWCVDQSLKSYRKETTGA